MFILEEVNDLILHGHCREEVNVPSVRVLLLLL